MLLRVSRETFVGVVVLYLSKLPYGKGDSQVGLLMVMAPVFHVKHGWGCWNLGNLFGCVLWGVGSCIFDS